MLSTKDISLVYETLLLSPGMNDQVKIPLCMSRQNVLLLAKLIQVGLSNNGNETGDLSLLSVAKKDSLAELNNLPDELLAKAGLQEMNLKLNALQTK